MRIWKSTTLATLAWALLGTTAAWGMDPPGWFKDVSGWGKELAGWGKDLPGWGVQAGLALPLGSDLSTTVGSNLNLSLGGHRDWTLAPGQVFRARLDLAWYGVGTQSATSGGLTQEIRTRVKSEAFGADYLLHMPWLGERWSVAPGLAWIRWTVDSSNRLERSTGRFSPSGASSWTRQALSLTGTYRWDRQREAELRLVSSHYGYENLPTRTATLNFLWHF